MSRIPKVIHYFWFGNKQKNNLVKKCIESWKVYLPDFEIKEWNEENYDVYKNDFTKNAFLDKQWAFLSDYARLDTLLSEGGVYLDTDMEVIKPLDPLLGHSLFFGMESETHVNGSIIGSVAGHEVLANLLKTYESMGGYTAIPDVLTPELKKIFLIENRTQELDGIAIYSTEYFYPFGFTEKFTKKCISQNTHTIHWWNNSWGSKKAIFLKRIGLLNFALSIKNIFSKK